MEESDEEFGWDDVHNVQIPLEEIKAARREELQFMQSRNLWTVVPKKECLRLTGKQPVSVRWVDTNKGRGGAIDVRSKWWREISKATIRIVTTYLPKRLRWKLNVCS